MGDVSRADGDNKHYLYADRFLFHEILKTLKVTLTSEPHKNNNFTCEPECTNALIGVLRILALASVHTRTGSALVDLDLAVDPCPTIDASASVVVNLDFEKKRKFLFEVEICSESRV